MTDRYKVHAHRYAGEVWYDVLDSRRKGQDDIVATYVGQDDADARCARLNKQYAKSLAPGYDASIYRDPDALDEDTITLKYHGITFWVGDMPTLAAYTHKLGYEREELRTERDDALSALKTRNEECDNLNRENFKLKDIYATSYEHVELARLRAEREKLLADRDAARAERDEAFDEWDAATAENDRLRVLLSETRAERGAALNERAAAIAERDKWRAEALRR